MENKKDIGKLFKDNLSQLDYSPSEIVWDKIETDLKKDKRKRRFFFWFFLFAILIIGTACYSYYHFNSNQTEKNNTKDNNTIYNSGNSRNSENTENPSNEIKTENKLNTSDSKTNTNSNQEQNNQLNNNKNSYTKYKTGFSNSDSHGKINSKLNSNSNESKIKTNKSNTKKKSSLSDLKAGGSKKYSVNKNSRNSKYNSSNSDVKSVASKKVSARKNSRNSKNKENDFSERTIQISYSNISTNSKKASKKNSSKNEIGKRSKKTKNSKTNKDNNLSKNSNKNNKTIGSNTNNTSITNSGNNSNEVNQSNSTTINITEIDSCCSDADCIIPIGKVKNKLEKKKLAETKKDSVIIKPTKKIVFSPFAGYNNYKKLGTDNKYGNSELINNQIKYGNFFGLKIKLMFSEKTGIQSGVSVNTYYYNTTIKKLNGNLETESIVLNQEPSQVNATFINDDEVTFQNHLRYIEIPFEAYYYFNTRKLSHATSFGLSFYFPLKNQVHAYSNTVTRVNIGESDAYLKQGYGVNLNYYINYNITDKIQVFISPAAQFQFLGKFDYGQPTSYNLSISTGINYKI